ncbi:MAG: hypothetical protein ABMB14_06920, partial [Myxococcota bacterium]
LDGWSADLLVVDRGGTRAIAGPVTAGRGAPGLTPDRAMVAFTREGEGILRFVELGGPAAIDLPVGRERCVTPVLGRRGDQLLVAYGALGSAEKAFHRTLYVRDVTAVIPLRPALAGPPRRGWLAATVLVALATLASSALGLRRRPRADSA